MALELGTNGVRAKFDSLNSQAAADFGFAFSKFAQKNSHSKNERKKIALARDMRKTSPCIFNAVASGLMEGGCDVLDLGILTSPASEWASMHYGADGLIIVTASHNAPEWNALKFVDWNGVAISRERGKFLNSFVGKPHAPILDWQKIGQIHKMENVTEEYKKAVISHIDISLISEKKLKIIADPGNGTATLIAPSLLRSLGAEVIVINEKLDGTFPGRASEPAEQNLHELIERVKKERADFGVAWDGDADRVTFVDEKGNWIVGDKCVALSCKWALLRQGAAAKNKYAITTSATSRVVEDVAKQGGAKIIYTDIGAPYLAEKIYSLGNKVIIGGEEVGGIIWPSFSFAKDGIFATCKLMEMICQMPLSSWVGRLPVYFNAKTKVDANPKQKEKAISNLLKTTKNKKQKNAKITKLIGGFRIDFQNSWVIVRASGTEDYVRIFAEAKSDGEAAALMNEYKDLVQKNMG